MAYMTGVPAEQSSSWTIMGVLLPQNGHGFKVLFAFLIAASNFFVVNLSLHREPLHLSLISTSGNSFCNVINYRI